MSKLKDLIAELCPDGVEYRPIGEVCTIKARIGWQRLTTSEYLDEGDYYLITGTDFTKNGDIDLSHCHYVTEDRYLQDKNIQVQNGDVLITKDGTLGKVAMIYGLDKPATLNSGLFVVRPINGVLTQRFLYYLLSSEKLMSFAEARSTGSTIKHLTQQIFVEFPIPVPPLAVQDEIVRILGNYSTFTAELIAKLEAELEARKKQYEYYRDLLLSFDTMDSTMNKSGGGSNLWNCIGALLRQYCPHGVEYKPLESCCYILDKRRKPITKSARESGTFPYYGANGIQDYVAEYIFDGKFILVGEDGSVITANGTPVVNWAEGKIWVNNHAHIIEEREGVLLRYLFHYLQIVRVKHLIHGNIPKLTGGDFKAISIPVPPLEVQERIVGVLDQFEKLCGDLREGLPAEIEARRKQYVYYRDQLLSFERKSER